MPELCLVTLTEKKHSTPAGVSWWLLAGACGWLLVPGLAALRSLRSVLV